MNILFCSSYAPSLVNFRGKLISELIKRGHKIYATAPDFPRHPDYLLTLKNMGVTTIDLSLARASIDVLQDAKLLISICRIINKFKHKFLTINFYHQHKLKHLLS